MAVGMAEMAIVRTQQREIDQLQEWLVAWYAN